MSFRFQGDEQARARALGALRDLPGVLDVGIDGDRLRIEYELREVNCAELADTLQNSGLAMVLDWRQRLGLKLRCYREAVHRDDMNNEIGWDSFVREVYVSRYRHRRHGRRDDRPRHWRQYEGKRPTHPE